MGEASAALQGIILATIAAGLGTGLRGFTGFSVLHETGVLEPTLVATSIGLLGHLLLYYLVFRPRIPRQDVLLAERIRLGMGLPARLLQGGIAEEVQFRWGLMSLVVAVTKVFFPSGSDVPFLLALVLSALLFALVHWLGARQIGLGRSGWDQGLILTDNVWAGIVFGFLLWKCGLAAAMVSHALLHAAWFPIEKRVYQRDLAAAGGG